MTTRNQTRVDPWGRRRTEPHRGTLMGNRGQLRASDDAPFEREWKGNRWITCRLDYRLPEGKVARPLLYTKLFFLDEATALAAGHRPCGTCRLKEHRLFRRLWVEANLPGADPATVLIAQIDKALDAERRPRGGTKPTWLGSAGSLPVGTLYEQAGDAWLVSEAGARRWSVYGYGPAQALPQAEVAVLTPRSIVATLRAGYLHQLTAEATA